MTSIAAAAPSRRLPRRIGAVFAGLFATFLVTTIIDVVLHVIGVFPPLGGTAPLTHALSALAFAYRVPINVAGCALTARLAPDRPVVHALVLGTIGVVASIAGFIALPDAGPAWYPLALAATSLPLAWIGGRIGARAEG